MHPCLPRLPMAPGKCGTVLASRWMACGRTATKRCGIARLKLLQQAVRRLSIARAHSIAPRMSTANHDVATRRKDVAHGVASRKNPGVQDGIVDPADEGGMGPLQHHDVAPLARGEATPRWSEPECPRAAGGDRLQQRAAS